MGLDVTDVCGATKTLAELCVIGRTDQDDGVGSGADSTIWAAGLGCMGIAGDISALLIPGRRATAARFSPARGLTGAVCGV